MSEDATFTLVLEPELRDQFMAEAQALQQPASQVLGDLMRDFVTRQRDGRGYDAWFRAELVQAMREADDPHVVRLDDEAVAASCRRQRDAVGVTGAS